MSPGRADEAPQGREPPGETVEVAPAGRTSGAGLGAKASAGPPVAAQGGPAGAPADAADCQDLRRDAAWIREIRGGRPEAFADLVDAYAPRLHAVLWRFLRDDDDLADVLQETLLRAFRSLDRYDATRPFYPWLRRIAVNAALSELERRKGRRAVDEPDLMLAALPASERDSPDRPVQGHELAAAVASALDSLPPRWAAVFRLRTNEELSYAEIAQTLDIPIGSVMSRLARARARLAETLAARFGPRTE
jgi:RNA polymerase sigma-70 factor (ECF subfamily)